MRNDIASAEPITPVIQIASGCVSKTSAPSRSARIAIGYYDRANGAIKCAVGTVSVGVKGAGLISILRGLLPLRTTH